MKKTEEKKTNITLNNAPVNTELILLQVLSTSLTEWMHRLGLFAGSILIRHDEEILCHPVRITASQGDVIVPAGLASKVLVHLDDGERRLPMVEMKRGTMGHVEAITSGMACVQALSMLGLKEKDKVTCVRRLPHMDYLTIIDRKERTRITEGEAAHIWGKVEGEKPTQFYFTRQGKTFTVQAIIGGQKAKKHLQTHGIEPGRRLVLETIEQAKELHAPGSQAVIITSPGGLRLYLNKKQAEQIIVKSAKRTGFSSKNINTGEQGL